MTPENFVYWLQGFFELTEIRSLGNNVLSPNQVLIIRDHLALVFDKQTPDRVEPDVTKPTDFKLDDELLEEIRKIFEDNKTDVYGPVTPNIFPNKLDHTIYC